MIGPGQASPVLVCLNLQQPYMDPDDPCYAPRGTEALIHARACIDWARRQDLPIWHVLTTKSGAASAPIPGFEPRPSEPVLLKRSYSLFDSAEVVRARPPLRQAFVVGFAAAKDCVAAAVDAERSGVQLAFITDAIASSVLPNQSPAVVDEVLASLLGEWALCLKTIELLRRQPRLAMA